MMLTKTHVVLATGYVLLLGGMAAVFDAQSLLGTTQPVAVMAGIVATLLGAALGKIQERLSGVI